MSLRNAYRDIIKAHINDCPPKELAARCELLKMRDAATIGMRTASDATAPLLLYIETMVTRYAFERMELPGLILLGSQLRTINETVPMLQLLEGYRDE